ncbi:AI-2E family transporter [Hornefia butyriciproducens]|uniref:AI-2E family transporter n=1 Tax=Hornefia butyriciproducens TaxID=2652293 RepID=UPI003F88D1D0
MKRGSKLKERFDEKYLKLGATLFLTAVAIILFYFILQNMSHISSAIGTLANILKPFIYGLIMAYLLCPVFNLVTRRTYHRLENRCKNKRRAFIFAKVMGTTAALAVLIAVFAAVAALLIPQIVKSIVALVTVMPDRIQDFSQWVTKMLAGSRYEALSDSFTNTVNHASEYLMKFIQKRVMPNVGGYVEMISQGLYMTIKTFLNILIGIIVAVYFLNSKEKFKAEICKIIYALFRRDKAEEIFEFGNFTNRTFGGFINGKIIDSLIIGLICFVLMKILGLPYVALCSTIVGVTNIIPFFGPFIGAVPSAIIICVIDPIKAGEFLIMIFALQQFDGNILGPKILGGTTGLSSFWVMFAIILGGGLFGFLGMILGVPVFAIIYHYFKLYTEKRLRRKGLAEETKDYQEFNKYDIDRRDIL